MTVAGAAETLSMSRREASDIKYIVLHHSATESGNVAVFRKHHMHQLGWGDIGYHFVICNGQGGQDGEIQEGRNILFAGAHAPGRNEDSVGICLVGDFTKAAATTAQKLALYGLLKDLMRRYCITPERILAHREVNETDCPGSLDVVAIRTALTKSPPKDWESHLHEEAIREAISLGIMAGNPDGNFEPDKPCSRAELAAVAVRTYHRVFYDIINKLKNN